MDENTRPAFIDPVTGETRTTVMRYWSPKEEACYTLMQTERMKEEDPSSVSGFTPIRLSEWKAILEKTEQEGKIIQNDPATNLPVAVDPPAPTDEELLEREREERRRYLEETNTEAILYLQMLMTPMTLPAEETAPELMTPEEYQELNRKRLEYAMRIREIDAVLKGGQPQD